MTRAPSPSRTSTTPSACTPPPPRGRRRSRATPAAAGCSSWPRRTATPVWSAPRAATSSRSAPSRRPRRAR
ncbi:MAG: hypothetical protein EPN99_04860 [Frankiales bacterium]|nr:MAG: hypothetical protein EPN99_04860 [Frankiales bacterium]